MSDTKLSELLSQKINEAQDIKQTAIKMAIQSLHETFSPTIQKFVNHNTGLTLNETSERLKKLAGFNMNKKLVSDIISSSNTLSNFINQENTCSKQDYQLPNLSNEKSTLDKFKLFY
jgi:hypothetical protein